MRMVTGPPTNQYTLSLKMWMPDPSEATKTVNEDRLAMRRAGIADEVIKLHDDGHQHRAQDLP